MPETDSRDAVLISARDRPRADTAEAGYDTIRTLTATSFSDAELAEAVAACVAEGLVRDPVRLDQGALQCHWRLELTPPSSCPRMRVSTSSFAASKDVVARIREHDGGGCEGNVVGPAGTS